MLPLLLNSLILALWPVSIHGHCPSGCICADKVVLCSCSGENQFDRLSPFKAIDYIGKVFVHSCEQLTIPEDTFSGLAVGQEISIMGIGNLTIEPFAFRDMLKYPDQFTVRDSAVHLFSENAFAGFQQAKHMWFRNITIRTLQQDAFKHISKVEYLYFREVHFQYIQRRAFAHLDQVGNVFIRSKVTIDHMGPSLFQDSRLDKFVLEDAKIGSMNAYALTGAIRLDSMQLSNVKIESTGFNLNFEDQAPMKPIEQGSKALLFNVVMDKMAVGTLSNIADVRFEHCQIERLSSGLTPLRKVGSISFVGCTVRRILPHAFINTSEVRSLKFENGLLERIERTAFRNVDQVDYLLFLGCTVKMIERRALDNCTIGTVIMDNVNIHEVEQGAFGAVRSARWQIVDSNLNRLAPYLFQDSQFEHFHFEKNNATGEGMARWLGRMHADYVNISGNWFARFQPELLSQISFHSMHLSGNKFRCLCDDGGIWLAEMTALDRLARGTTQPVVSVQTDNLCWDVTRQMGTAIAEYRRLHCPKVAAESMERRLPIQGLSCTTLSLWTECNCVGKSSVQLDFASISAPLNTSVLRISNCSQLEISSALAGSVQTVIFKNSKIVFGTQPFTRVEGLKSIRIEDSKVRFDQRHVFTSRSRMVQVEMKKVYIDQLPVHSLSNSNLEELLIEDCTLGRLAPSMAEGSNIARLVISRSLIERMTWSAFQGITGHHLLLTDNEIAHLDGASFLPAATERKQMCFENNRVGCEDTQELIRLIEPHSTCDVNNNKCLSREHLSQSTESHRGTSSSSSLYPQRLFLAVWMTIILLVSISIWS